MQQLSGFDSTFIFSEFSNSPMHIGPLLIYDPSSAKGGKVRFKDILRTFESKLDQSAVFRRKLAKVPLNLDYPYWVEDENFDLEYHVRHIALPKPGDWRQLFILAARIFSRPLDRARPLWEATVIEGLDNIEGLPRGCFAILLKIHHAAIDGASGMEIMGAIHDTVPNPTNEQSSGAWEPEREPGDSLLLARSLMNYIKQPFRMLRVARDSVPALRKVRLGRKQQIYQSLGQTERTRFNREITPHRVFGAVNLALDDIRTIKASVANCTVNDVILTVVSFALTGYLTKKGEAPKSNLIAGAPINIRPPDDAEAGGNQVSMMRVSLCSDIESPLERLRSINQSAVSSKAYHKAMGATLLTDLTNSLPSHIAALGFRAASAAGLTTGMSPIFNTIVTNVPGPQQPIYMGEAKLVRTIGTGPCIDNMGLFHAVLSYNRMVNIAFLSCREMMPDPGFYEECIRGSFETLLEAAQA